MYVHNFYKACVHHKNMVYAYPATLCFSIKRVIEMKTFFYCVNGCGLLLLMNNNIIYVRAGVIKKTREYKMFSCVYMRGTWWFAFNSILLRLQLKLACVYYYCRRRAIADGSFISACYRH